MMNLGHLLSDTITFGEQSTEGAATFAIHFDSTLFQTPLPKIVALPTLELSIAWIIHHQEKGLKRSEERLRTLLGYQHGNLIKRNKIP